MVQLTDFSVFCVVPRLGDDLMSQIVDRIEQQLTLLIALPLSITHRAADMRIFHFGEVHTDDKGSFAQYAIHVQCAWRIEGPGDIITGRSDLWEPAQTGPDFDWKSWDYDTSENLQDHKLSRFLNDHTPGTYSAPLPAARLIVERIEADTYGGATIHFSGNYRLRIFPAGSEGEDWRIFEPNRQKPHFVIAGGKIEA